MKIELAQNLMLTWSDPPAPESTDTPEEIDLPGLEHLAAILSMRPGQWAQVAGDVGQNTAEQIAYTLRVRYPEIDAVHRLHHPPAFWGVWARQTVGAEAPRPLPVQVPLRSDLQPGAAKATAKQKKLTTTAREQVKVLAKGTSDQAKRAAKVKSLPPLPCPPELEVFRPGTQGVPTNRADLDYAHLAKHYARLVEEGKSPNPLLARMLGTVPGQASVYVQEARRRGLLTENPNAAKRLPGGELTQKAKVLLHESEPPTPTPPPSPQPAVRVEHKPTPEQQAEIDRIKAENKQVLQDALNKRLASSPESTAELPDTCDPISSVTELLPWLREPANNAMRAGWMIGKQRRNGHYLWVGPDGQRTVTPSTNTEGGSNVQKMLSDLRRIGVPVGGKHHRPKAQRPLASKAS